MLHEIPKFTEIRDFLLGSKWTFAKTMADIPHEWIARNDVDQKTFLLAFNYIEKYGQEELFLKRKWKYIYIDGYKYWGARAKNWAPVVINRAETQPSPYDSLQLPYDEMFSGQEYKEEDEVVMGAMYNHDVPSGNLLDIGCGSGLFVEHLNYPASLYTGLDPSSQMLSYFADKLPYYDNRIILTRFEDFEVKPQTYDSIISLYGSPAYIDPASYEKILNGLTAGGKYFLMFFEDDYKPHAHHHMSNVPEHFRPPINELASIFDQVTRWGKYFIVTNFELNI